MEATHSAARETRRIVEARALPARKEVGQKMSAIKDSIVTKLIVLGEHEDVYETLLFHDNRH